MVSIILGIAIPVVVGVFLFLSYIKAPPDKAYIVSGLKKKPRVYIGKAGFKIPFFERLDKLSLGAIQIDVKTKSAVPTAEYINVKVDSTVSVRVGQSVEMIALAAQNFLNVDRNTIATKVNDLLEGNIREIVGQMKLTEMVSDRKAFSAKVQDNVVPDLEKLGLEMITFNVQNFMDDNDVITNLGIDNIAQISKNAAIAKSNAEREVAIAQAENAKKANDAKVQAAEEIAIRNNALEVKQAELKQIADTQQAQADAAKEIEAENQRKLRVVAETNANIAQAEREAELKQKEIELKEYELDAIVRKQADAEKYAAEKKAEAELIKRQRDAEAKAYEVEMAAKAQKAKAEADKFAAEQQAAGIAAVGAAEAEAIQKKAEAQKLMGEASILEMYFQMLPKAIASASGPLANVDKITMYGEGNSAKLAQDVMKTADQVIKSIEETTGIDAKVFISSLMGSKAAQ